MSQGNPHHYAQVYSGEYSGSVSSDAAVNFKKGRRFITVATIVSFCFNIGLLMILIMYHQNDISDSNDKSNSAALRPAGKWLKDSVCVECGLLGMSTEQASSRKSGWLLSLQKEQLCCLGEAWGLWRLLDLFTMKMRMNQLTGPWKATELPVPSAHLYLDSLADNIKWTDENGFGAAHIIKSIKFRDKSYHIEQAGFYNIYSFITLKRRTDFSRSTLINHSIKLITKFTKPHAGVVLQKNVELPHRSESFATSYLSGVVQLNFHDVISVDVSDRTAVYRFAPSNFFGLHLFKKIQQQKNSS